VLPKHPALLVGIETLDDAGVVRLRDDLALVQTVDIFPPVVDDPYWFGRIAAANSLSDVYAMGGEPVAAVNFVGYPLEKAGGEALRLILQGSFDALAEAECAMAGGHSIKDEEIKFGLAVVGSVHPDRIVRNSSARAGDLLVLSKPLGVGCLTTALKQGKAAPEHVDAAQRLMARLNRNAAAAMLRHGATAATDVTGYGLLGHGYEMAEAADLSLRIEARAVPALAAAREYLRPAFVCGGSQRNLDFGGGRVTIAATVTDEERILMHDVQTSGGLMIAVPPDRGDALVHDLRAGGDEQAAVIGEFCDQGPRIEVV